MRSSPALVKGEHIGQVDCGILVHVSDHLVQPLGLFRLRSSLVLLEELSFLDDSRGVLVPLGWEDLGRLHAGLLTTVGRWSIWRFDSGHAGDFVRQGCSFHHIIV